MAGNQVPATWMSVLNSLITGSAEVPKSISKLINTISDNLGLFCKPYHIRRIAEAEADAEVIRADTKGEVAVIRFRDKLAIQEIKDRAEERVRLREDKRQENLEAIVGMAAREMPNDVSENPVDPDWTAEFFNKCQDVSNQQMQSMWARLLAGEVVKPGSFSLRTLALVRTLTKEDADLFTRFCSMLWMIPNLGLRPIIVPSADGIKSIPGIQLSFDDFVRLDSIGLIKFEIAGHFNINVTLTMGSQEPEVPQEFGWVIGYYGRLHKLTPRRRLKPNETFTFALRTGQALLSTIGQELALISGSVSNEEYRQQTLLHLRLEWDVTEP